MMKFTVRRILEAIPTLIGITLIAFILIHIVPGSPVRVLLGQHYTVARAHALTKQLGLDKPLWDQYVIWLWKLVQGNFGYSYVYNQSVLSLIFQALPHTLAIVTLAILAAHIFSVFIGSVQAYYQNSLFDQVVTIVNYFFYSMPNFWLGILLVIFFAIGLHWFPTGGIVNTQLSHPGFMDWLHHVILPVATLFVVTIAGWARFMRSSMREALLQDYVRTARMKGASEFRTVFVHGLRNSIIPLITLLGMSLPVLLAGALFIEEIFNYPGMGLLYWHAVNERDFPVILGITVFLGVLTVLGNFLADILYALIDPRIQYK
ncbi:ABC transporter permease [Alicyclobacillus sp. SO9]|uniref:ABC transporter permease n=1 Tax=Alicyclobacillus sp. SO9 TaxID=2665646 RepID=UPI0018E82631|nr:ABC transporter permease [Alicyclobacillus sp. SO9]QQE79147.1 ABC transporter permease [Alicyclobacillus sp. SO9]